MGVGRRVGVHAGQPGSSLGTGAEQHHCGEPASAVCDLITHVLQRPVRDGGHEQQRVLRRDGVTVDTSPSCSPARDHRLCRQQRQESVVLEATHAGHLLKHSCPRGGGADVDLCAELVRRHTARTARPSSRRTFLSAYRRPVSSRTRYTNAKPPSPRSLTVSYCFPSTLNCACSGGDVPNRSVHNELLPPPMAAWPRGSLPGRGAHSASVITRAASPLLRGACMCLLVPMPQPCGALSRTC